MNYCCNCAKEFEPKGVPPFEDDFCGEECFWEFAHSTARKLDSKASFESEETK